MISTSNILVVGPDRPHFNDFGVTFVPTDREARSYLGHHQPAVVVFGDSAGAITNFDDFCRDVRARCPDARWILTSPSPDQIMTWANEGCLHGVVDDLEDPELPAKLQSALECKGESEQRRRQMGVGKPAEGDDAGCCDGNGRGHTQKRTPPGLAGRPNGPGRRLVPQQR